MADEHDKRVRGSAIPRAYEPVGGDALLVRTEADMKGLLVSNHVWDSDAGAWVKMVQPSIETGDIFVAVDDIESKLDDLQTELEAKADLIETQPVSLEEVGYISTGNSSVAELADDGVFTGTAEDVLDYASLSVVVYSDKASIADGLQLQFTPDPGVGWVTVDSFTIAATTPKIIVYPILAQYFRLVYTNGGTTQNTFILATTYKKIAPGVPDERIDGDITGSDLAAIAKTVIFGKTPDGTYTNVPLSPSGCLAVSDRDTYWSDVRMEYSGSVILYRGRHTDLNAATSDTNWSIEKYTFDGDNCTRVQRQTTSWDDRAAGWS